MSSFRSLADTQKNLKSNRGVKFATVLDVDAERGVKIRLYGQQESEVPDIYYTALQYVNVGDKVYITEEGGEYIIHGKLLY